jgi:hypothetical protein
MNKIKRVNEYARWCGGIALTICASAALCGAAHQEASLQAADPGWGGPEPTLEETRITMGKWIETQQIIARERNDWQQGREILVSRIDLVKKEASSLEDKIQAAQGSVERRLASVN